jgi:hypothetical protein
MKFKKILFRRIHRILGIIWDRNPLEVLMRTKFFVRETFMGKNRILKMCLYHDEKSESTQMWLSVDFIMAILNYSVS